MLLVSSTLPLFYMKALLTQIAGNTQCLGFNIQDAKGFINYNLDPPFDKPAPEVTELMHIIDSWKCACNKRAPSAALILSGDVHLGGFTDIYSTNSQAGGGAHSIICRQISSGAISLKEASSLLFKATKKALNFTDSYGGFTYNHYNWTKNTNYAVIRVDMEVKKLTYTVSLKTKSFQSSHSSIIEPEGGLKEEFWSIPTASASNCCNIV